MILHDLRLFPMPFYFLFYLVLGVAISQAARSRNSLIGSSWTNAWPGVFNSHVRLLTVVKSNRLLT